MMDVLRLKGLQFHGKHGTEEWEKQTGCRFIVDIELTYDFAKSVVSDRLEDTLDYRVIYSRTRHVVESESHNLIERVAGRVMHEMFRTFRVSRVVVRVAKPEARIGGLNQAVEIELDQTREEWERTYSPAAGADRGAAS